MQDATSTPAAQAPVDTGDTSIGAASNRKTALTDAFRTHFSGDAPLADKAKGFAKARPWTSAAFVGIAGIALLNMIRGRR